ncbi:extensin family protein [Paracoccus sp. (in: a-proteobacteria)]|uniref:extensin-like domain-containing protein n=1 Tax=Paracoccus sp. TaxID=267 RepID=UPI0035B46C82
MRGLWRAVIITLATALPLQAQQAPPPRPAGTEVTRPAPRPDAPIATADAIATGDPPASAKAMPDVLRESDFDDAACRLELTRLGADFSTPPPLTDPAHRDCGIARPILLRQPLPGIEISGGALMRCDTARHLAHWLRDFVRPAAAMLPGQPRLVGIAPGTTYDCRPTIGNDGANLSEHAFGNAFDIAAFRFQDGSRIEIAPRRDSGDPTEGFQRALRGTACLHFTTVLGPGANAAHANHLHLDIKARPGGWRLCQ